MRLTTFVVLTSFALASARAQKSNLSQLSSEALGSHPAIASARAERDMAVSRREMSVAMFRPQLSINGAAATGNGSMIFPGSVEPVNYAQLPSGDSAVANGTFMWRLFSFGRDRDVSSAGAFDVRSADSVVQVAGLDVLLGVRTAFTEALFKHDVHGAHLAALQSAQNVEKVTQAKFEAGKVAEAFLLRAKADTARAERDVAMADADADAALARLWEAVGRDQSQGGELGEWDTELQAPQDLRSAIATALERRPELMSVRLQIKAAESRRAAAEKSRLPELNVMAMNDIMGSRDSRGESAFKAGLVLSFPIGDGGRRSAEVSEQKAMADRLRSDERMAANRVSSEVAQAWADWRTVAAVKTAATAELKSSEESYRVLTIRYEEGKAILAELTDARSMLTHAMLSVAEAADYERRAWSRLARAIGE